MKRLLISCPTSAERQPIEDLLDEVAGRPDLRGMRTCGSWQIATHASGPGVPMVLLHLGRAVDQFRPDLLIHAGIAGVRKGAATIGEAVEIISDRYADIGAEDRDGSFLDMHYLGLWRNGDAPWSDGVFRQPSNWGMDGWRHLDAVTVHTIPGTAAHIDHLAGRYPFEVESMEGAAVFHLALHHDLPFLAVRGISNYLEPRNRESWDIPSALCAMAQATREFLRAHLA